MPGPSTGRRRRILLRHLVVLGLFVTLLTTAMAALEARGGLPNPNPRGPGRHQVPAAYRFLMHHPPDGTEVLFLRSLLCTVLALDALYLILLGTDRLPRTRAGRIALALAALAVAFPAVELPLRAAERADPSFFVPDPVLFWKHRPGLRDYPTPFGSVSTNSFSLRGPETTRARPEGTYRVLVLGDSTLFGHGVREDETFAQRLERELAPVAAPHPVEVLNGAVQGYTTWQGLDFLERQGLRFDPTLLIVGFNNDPEIDLVPDRERAAPLRAVRPLAEALYSSTSYLLLRKVLVNLRIPSMLPEQAELEVKVRRGSRIPDRMHRVPLDDFRGNLQRMAELARGRGIPMILLVLPRDPAQTPRYPNSEYREAMLAAATEPGVRVLDLFQEWQAPEYARYFRPGDPMHPRAAGQARMAAQVAEAIAPLVRAGAAGLR